MQNEGSPFIVIYDSMLALELPVKSLLVLAHIYGYTRNGDGCFCDRKKNIAERLGMQPSGFSRALRTLFSKVLITEIWDRNGRHLETPSCYNYSGPFIVVYDWMLDRNLSGCELLVFALIYGLCVDGKKCYGRREWIEKKLHITNVGKVISKLKKKGLVKETYYPDKSSILVASFGGSNNLTERSKNLTEGVQFENEIAENTFNDCPF